MAGNNQSRRIVESSQGKRVMALVGHGDHNPTRFTTALPSEVRGQGLWQREKTWNYVALDGKNEM